MGTQKDPIKKRTRREISIIQCFQRGIQKYEPEPLPTEFTIWIENNKTDTTQWRQINPGDKYT